MRTFEQLQSLFIERVPDEFPARLVAGLETAYRDSFDEARELPIPFQRYILPHNRRLKAELVLLTAGGAAGLTTRVATNASNDGHALVMSDPFVFTASKTGGALTPPRPAAFRQAYSSKASLAQFPLGIDGFGDEAVELQSDSAAIYVIIAHGPNPSFEKRDELGFVFAHFAGPGAVRFIGPGIDLREQYGRGPSEGEARPMPPRPPEIRPRES